MGKKTKVLSLVIALIVASSIISATAFTTATLSRDTTVNVVSDSNGIIALTDGTSGGLVDQVDGELKIDFTNAGSGVGANVNSRYELGDPNNPTSEMAFNITNQDTVDHDLSIEYTGADDEGESGNQIEFQVYDGNGDHLTTVSEGSTVSIGSADFTSGDTLYVVVVVDTSGMSTSGDLSGTLNITAT
jgi:hypothetical protein